MSGIRLMGFWAKQGNDGEVYHEGKLGGATVRLFVNKYKQKDTHPDVVMYISQTPLDAKKGAPVKAPSRITQKTQTPAQHAQRGPIVGANPQPPKQDYVDHTKGGYGVAPNEEVPWPTDDELPF